MIKKEIENIGKDPEFGLDFRYQSKQEEKESSIALMESRLIRLKNLKKDQIIQARLLQLKLKMEEYSQELTFEKKNAFYDFLAAYIDLIYSKRSGFARDINISPVSLSQIMNRHREPKEEFLKKLIVHSEKVFETMGGFPESLWHQVYFKDKISNIMINQNDWRSEVESEVSFYESML